MIKLILAIFEAVPIIDKWIQQLTLAYVNQQKEKNNAEFTKALEDATKTKDVSNLASSIGSKLDN